MKSKFVNQDGTLNRNNIVILVVLILVVALSLIYLLFFKSKNITGGAQQIQTTGNNTNVRNKCNNCKIKFKNDVFELESNSEYYVKDLLEVENIVINNVKLVVEDVTLAEMKNDGKELVLRTKEKIGKTYLVARVDDKEVKTELKIKAGEITRASLLDHPYYVYLNTPVKMELNTLPVGLDASYFEVYVDNPEIVSLTDDGTLVGLAVGETYVHLKFNETESTQKIIVLSSNIDIKCKLKNGFEDCYNVDYNDLKNDSLDFLITIDGKYTVDDLKYRISDEGIDGNISYDGKELGQDNTYHYKLSITRGDGEGSKMTIIFTLPDGTSKNVVITDN